VKSSFIKYPGRATGVFFCEPLSIFDKSIALLLKIMYVQAGSMKSMPDIDIGLPAVMLATKSGKLLRAKPV
jgi:hypothetical protein